MLRPIRFSLVILVLALSAFFGAGAAAAQTLPPSLQGEQFNAQDGTGGVANFGEVDISGSCTPTPGETFTLTYRVEGFALGPYPGTFTENGTVTVLLTTNVPGVPGSATGIVTSWRAEFTIDSYVGQVSGSKTLSATQPIYSFMAVCRRASPIFYPFTDQVQAIAGLDYEATIRTATGTFTDRGLAEAQVNRYCGQLVPPTCVVEAELFYEGFSLSTGVLPLDTTGKATGGGQIGDITSFAQVTFGFEVKKTEDPDRLQGRCLVNDRAKETHVKCLTVTSYQQVGNTATWEGTAEVNGVREHYRITVQDNGEPNQGIDTFSIKTDTYDAAGNVTHGNVQLHKQPLGL